MAIHNYIGIAPLLKSLDIRTHILKKSDDILGREQQIKELDNADGEIFDLIRSVLPSFVKGFKAELEGVEPVTEIQQKALDSMSKKESNLFLTLESIIMTKSIEELSETKLRPFNIPAYAKGFIGLAHQVMEQPTGAKLAPAIGKNKPIFVPLYDMISEGKLRKSFVEMVFNPPIYEKGVFKVIFADLMREMSRRQID